MTLTIDLVAPGPPPTDLYDPGAAAWALASGLANRGHSVRVVHPTGTASGPAPAGVGTATYPAIARHLGYAEGDAELAHAARRQLRPGADLVVRDPLRPGALGVGRTANGPAVVAVVRSLELERLEEEAAGPNGRSVGGRWTAWRTRSAARKFERAALAEADRVLTELPDLAGRLSGEYGVEASRIAPIGRATWLPAEPPHRDQARASVGVPLDDPLVTVVSATDDPDDLALQLAREAFRRLRPIFAGARLVLAGAATQGGNGMTVAPSRDVESIAGAVAAADIAVFLPKAKGIDPGVALAWGTSVATIVGPTVTVPPEAEGAVKRVGVDGSGDLASALAELLSDASARKELARRGSAYVTHSDPGKVAAEVEAAYASARPTAR